MAGHEDLVRTARRHATRPTPVLGGPWWIYAVPFAAANGLRQLLLPGLATWQQVATFVATAVVVGAVVAFGWRRWEAAHPGDP